MNPLPLDPAAANYGIDPDRIGLMVGSEWESFQKKFMKTDADRALARRASPTAWVDAKDPPTYLIHGTKDIHVPKTQTELLGKLLDEMKIVHKTTIVEGAPHSFDFRLKQLDMKADLLPFLDEHLKN